MFGMILNKSIYLSFDLSVHIYKDLIANFASSENLLFDRQI